MIPMQCCEKQLLFVTLLIIIASAGVVSIKPGSEEKFDFFVYTQQWPQTVCLHINETEPNKGCLMSESIKTWTVHGLWPSKFTEKGPFYCNSSWPFNLNGIKNLIPELDRRWPNMIAHTKHADFWKHEWEKHGTCAALERLLNSEFKYFNTSLNLQYLYNLDQIFSQSNVLPSVNSIYRIDKMRSILEGYTKSHTHIQCVVSKDRSRQLLVQIEVCINTNFKPINCVNYDKHPDKVLPYNPDYEDCLDDIPLIYPPIRHNVKNSYINK